MIRVSSSLLKSIFTNSTSLTSLTQSNKLSFAKQPKAGKQDKKGGKQQKKQQAPVQQPTEKLKPHQKILNYFTPLQPNLSPSQKHVLNEGFSDLHEEQKQMLDKLATKIAGLNTSMFYNLVYKREALGSTEGLIVGSGKFQDAQVNEAISILRKDI